MSKNHINLPCHCYGIKSPGWPAANSSNINKTHKWSVSISNITASCDHPVDKNYNQAIACINSSTFCYNFFVTAAVVTRLNKKASLSASVWLHFSTRKLQQILKVYIQNEKK